ncbi:MAG: GNAT family N-acetyltransferase [Chloroflexota bacterium]|nr:GNAT family N-acetyltransferase [Chloroflexota bacterium]
MQTLEIRQVETEDERRAFLSLPWEVYKDNSYWVPPIFSERVAFTNPDENAFFRHADVAFFMALRGERVVGTIAAFANHRHNEFHHENIAFFGFFEVLKDAEAAEALLKRAEDWARERGYTALRGPAQFSVNDECGLLVDGFDDRPRILMTYNPPYYVNYIEKRGYTTAMDLWAYSLSTDLFTKKSGERLTRLVEKVRKRSKITFRKINMKDFNGEVKKFKDIFLSAWVDNWGFVPMDEAEFDQLAEELQPIVDPDLVFIAEVEGKPVGFSLTLPDLNEPLRLAYPRPETPEWWTMAKLVWHWKVRKKVSWIRVFAMGVIPEYRVRGIDALFYYESAKAAIKKGIPQAEMSWILESNDKMNEVIRSLGGEVYKTYRFYEKKL